MATKYLGSAGDSAGEWATWETTCDGCGHRVARTFGGMGGDIPAWPDLPSGWRRTTDRRDLCPICVEAQAKGKLACLNPGGWMDPERA